MHVETEHGRVDLSARSGERLLGVFSSRWPMPVVALQGAAARYGIAFQVGDKEAWCLLYSLPAAIGSDVELVLTLLQQAIGEALVRLAERRLPGLLLPCPCLVESELGGLIPGMAVFSSDVPEGDGPVYAPLSAALVELLATTPAGAQLPPFTQVQRAPRMTAGAIKLDTALVDGQPLCFRQPGEDPIERADLATQLGVWAAEGVKHLPWAPALPLCLSVQEAAALEPEHGEDAPEPATADAREPLPSVAPVELPPSAPPPPAEPALVVPSGEVSAEVPSIRAVPSGSHVRLPDAESDPLAWGPTVLDASDAMRNTADRELLIRLRGEPVEAGSTAAEQAPAQVAPPAAPAAHPEPGDREGDGPEALHAVSDHESVEPGAVGEPTPAEDPRVTAGYSRAVASRRPDAIVSTHGYTSGPDARTGVEPPPGRAGPSMLSSLAESPWGELHAFAGDGAHAAMLCSGLRRLVAGRGLPWPAPLPAADAVSRHGSEILLMRGEACGGIVSVRLARTLDAVELARLRAKVQPEKAVAITLDEVDPGPVPSGWEILPIDHLMPVLGAVAGDHGPARDHLDFLRRLLACRDALRHEARTDATAWQPVIGATAVGASLLHRLHRELMAGARAGLSNHGWPAFDPERAARGEAPGRRVYEARVWRRGDEVASEVCILDPASPHAYGIRALGGRVTIFGEAFDVRRTHLPPRMARGRRNEFLRDVGLLLQLGADCVEGHATDASRRVEIDTYDLLRADRREQLAQTFVETAWVLWQRTRAGRLTLR